MPDSPLAVARSVCRARGLLTQHQAQHIWSQRIFCCSVVGRLAASYRWRHSWQHAIESHAATDGGFVAGAQESCRAHTPARLTAAAVGDAEKLSSRHVLPRDLSNALKQLDDGDLERLFAATRHELQRRGRSLTTTPVIRPTTHVATERRASDQSM